MSGAEPCECDRHPLGARLTDWTCPTHGSFPGSFSADEVDREARAGNTMSREDVTDA